MAHEARFLVDRPCLESATRLFLAFGNFCVRNPLLPAYYLCNPTNEWLWQIRDATRVTVLAMSSPSQTGTQLVHKSLEKQDDQPNGILDRQRYPSSSPVAATPPGTTHDLHANGCPADDCPAHNCGAIDYHAGQHDAKPTSRYELKFGWGTTKPRRVA